MLTVGEKFRGNAVDRKRSFLDEFVHYVGAIDLGFVGKWFTWENL